VSVDAAPVVVAELAGAAGSVLSAAKADCPIRTPKTIRTNDTKNERINDLITTFRDY
jgi:hypothetical protein